ncbi:ABC transporter permease [Agrococcus jejuensis]|uniref:Transport permease protein n=1 Tax=Agrococcus jejuensis TaxID=399736 RepID=A0A1G8F8P4_9MICO|nr:lipooligosaccharide transport system permease protein [Agrococcus jejuensis]
MTVHTSEPLLTQRPRGPLSGIYAGNARAVIGRGMHVMRRNNLTVVVSGFFEPIFYLLSMGIGLGTLIGVLEYRGVEVPYAAYIAPALMAVSAMNGAVFDSTMNVFFKMHYGKLYDGMLSTSLGPLDVALGEIFMALFRGFLYACGFMAVTTIMGLNLSPTALLAIPAAVLIAFAFASLGMAITSYMKTFQHLDYVYFVMMPMFLLSATFFPIEVYPPTIQWIIMAMPLWHGVDMMRQLTLGVVDWSLAIHVGYLAVMSVLGIVFTTSRLKALFLR